MEQTSGRFDVRSRHFRRYFVVIVAAGLIVMAFTSIKDNLMLKSKGVSVPPSVRLEPVDRIPCMDPKAKNTRVEDVFCIRPPEFVKELKNPCFYDSHDNHTKLACLPYFLLLGMGKCGTTDLHTRIVMHPDIRPNKGVVGKEVMYWGWSRYAFQYNSFDRVKNMTFIEYLTYFDETAKELETSKNKNIITGDWSPQDLAALPRWMSIPQNQGKLEPDIMTPHMIRHIYEDFVPKFFIQLREPVDRLYSDYVFRGGNPDPETFHEKAMKSMDMLRECEKKKSRRWCFYDKDLYINFLSTTRIHLSCYSVFLADWLRVYPREAFHITRMEDLSNNTGAVMKSIFSFLDVDIPPSLMENITKTKRQHATKGKKTYLQKTRDELMTYFARCNEETATLLQDDAYLWKDHQ